MKKFIKGNKIKLIYLTIMGILVPSNLVMAVPYMDDSDVQQYQLINYQKKLDLWSTENPNLSQNFEYDYLSDLFNVKIVKMESREITISEIIEQIENEPLNTEITEQGENKPLSEETFSTSAKDLLTDKPINFNPIARSPESPVQPQETKKTLASIDPTPTKENQHSDLAKQSQNPVANLISVPFQNNINFGVGQFDRTNNTLDIQPVVPFALNEDLLLVNRPIIPIVYQPELARIRFPNGETESIGDDFGLGDIVYQAYLTSSKSSNFILAGGPVLLFPTATDESLGSGKWGAGPGLVGILTKGPIVTGVLVNNVWSFAGDEDRSDVSLMTINPFFNYNFEGGWYLSTSPNLLANWLAEGEKWLIPIGGGFGRVFSIGKQPVNMSLRAYWNVVKPEGAADWTLQYTFTLLFPE